MVKRSSRSMGSGSANPQTNANIENQPVVHPLANMDSSEWPENNRPNFGISLRLEKQRKRFDKLMTRTLQPSRYAHEPTLTKLGLYEDVHKLADRIGIWDYISMKVPTYRTLTFEFLATVEEHNNYSSFSFQLDGKTYRITDKELNDVLQFPNNDNGLIWEPTWKEERNDQAIFEEKIIGAPRNGYRSTQINHPVLRYLQRCLGFSIFARGETVSVLNKYDNFFLYCMLHLHEDPELQPDVGTFIMRHVLRIANSTAAGGVISIGGLVTRLAFHFDVLSMDSPIYRMKVPGKKNLDFEYLKTSLLIKQRGTHYFHIASNKELVPLPIETPLDPADPTTWIVVAPPPPPPPPPQQPPPPNPHDQAILDQLNTMNTQLTARFDQLENRINTRFDDLYGWAQDIDQRVYDVWQLSSRLHNWHVNNADYPEIDPQPYRPRRTRHPMPPPQDDAPSSSNPNMDVD